MLHLDHNRVSTNEKLFFPAITTDKGYKLEQA
jgi:hypothetical protein